MSRKEVIVKTIAGELTWIQAADILGITARHLRRLKQRWERHGYDGLVDYRGGKPRRTRIALATIEQVCTLKRQRYPDFSVQHFWEQLGPRCTALKSRTRGREAGPAGGRARGQESGAGANTAGGGSAARCAG